VRESSQKKTVREEMKETRDENGEERFKEKTVG
jgi:hypothetical protein